MLHIVEEGLMLRLSVQRVSNIHFFNRCLSYREICPTFKFVRLYCLFDTKVCPTTMCVRLLCLSNCNVLPTAMFVWVQCLSDYSVCPITKVCPTQKFVRLQCLSDCNVCPTAMFLDPLILVPSINKMQCWSESNFELMSQGGEHFFKGMRLHV